MAGVITTTAIAVLQFLPVHAFTVPIAIGIGFGMRNLSRTRNETFRHEIEGFLARECEASKPGQPGPGKAVEAVGNEPDTDED